MENPHHTGRRRRILLLTLLVCGLVLIAVSLGALALQGGPPAAATPAPVAVPIPTPTATPAPTPTPTPEPVIPFDFTQPAPETAPAAEDYFNDAVFLGDSRTDGLRLYSGIRGADFLAYKALMVFGVTGTHGVSQKKIPVGETKMTVLDALGQKQYGKVYLMFGVNELGWNNSADFDEAFRALIGQVRALQPDAVIYIESLIPVNPAKCKASKSPTYITNDRIAAYNEILRTVAADEGAVYLDLATPLADEAGELPAEGTSDGIHFTRSYYKKWLEQLTTHTVDLEVYQAGLPAEGDVPNA